MRHNGQTPARRLRVLFVDTSHFFGPLVQVHSRIMRHLDPGRFDVALLADKSGEPAVRLRDVPHLQVWSHRLGGGDTRATGLRLLAQVTLGTGLMLASLPAIVMRARRYRPDVIHTGLTARMITLGLMLRLATGARLVVHMHTRPRKARRLRWLLLRRGLAAADAIVTVSDYVKEQLPSVGVSPAKACSAINTIDMSRFGPHISGERIRREYGIPSDAVLVVCLGRFYPGKGQEYVVRSVHHVRDEEPSLRALCIGWDDRARSPNGQSYRGALDLFVEEHGLEGRVVLDAARPEAPEIMAAADIVAAPSVNDACPLTVIEAMASGKPIVGFASGGIPEEVGEDGGAVLVAPGDESAFTRTLIELARNPERRRIMGELNRRRAERHFYEARLAEDMARLYERLTRA